MIQVNNMTLQCGAISQLTQSRENHHASMKQSSNDDLLCVRQNSLSFANLSTERNSGENLARKLPSSSPSTGSGSRNAPKPLTESSKQVFPTESNQIQMSSMSSQRIGVQVPRKSDIIFGRGGG
jgi:hypothetical protein